MQSVSTAIAHTEAVSLYVIFMHTLSLLVSGQHPKEALNSLSKPEGLWWNFQCAHEGPETDISFAWLCLKWRRAASTFCVNFFFYSVPVQRSSTLSQFLPSSVTSLCSLYYVQFAFFSHKLWWMLSQSARLRISQQSCWRLSWDAVLCFWARDTQNLDLVTSSSFSSFQLNQAPVSVWVHFCYAFQLIH